ncbi:hypothetical protein BJD55_gp130 [Gordonia phage Yvonnetastic]|uniref:Uncharacterized protein n=1 Tax=Gordonia phage Yvonnetastic TaxID=1821566 RepID=A0A142K953_9CAUD|nr:hypothetical protein BJD55_gp130 [Gordonia phage Yvonnetastic]AMS02636.1 hypothetical protein SEA_YVONNETASTIC_92 [Gordonia phage Yvonnetastic]WKW86068.1 hypothetical protein SEA_JONJAMES_94 [Gordonia Phage JonJames]
MTEVNVELIDKVLEAVEKHPEQHDQGSWGFKEEGCGTTMCVAGWAVVLSGHPHTWERSGCQCCGNYYHLTIPERDQYGVQEWERVGAELLGIPHIHTELDPETDSSEYHEWIAEGNVDWAYRLFNQADEEEAKQILVGLRDGTIVPCPMNSSPEE